MTKHFSLVLVFLLLCSSLATAQNTAPAQPGVVYNYMQMTSIESVVPGGLGRSRLMFTTPDGKQEEMELKNFFSLTGINFKNVTQNDVAITEMVSRLSAAGWELAYVTSGVYSAETSTGIFITRYMFRRPKQ